MANNVAGIDVSHYQGTVDWNGVKQAGVSFGFAKATEGTSTADDQFSANWSGMKSAGIIRGAYHFFHPSEDATAQANYFLQTVSLEPGDLPPVIDIEDADYCSSSVIIAGLQTWLDVVAQSTGLTAIVYVACSFGNDYLDGQFGAYPLWIANYDVQSPTLPNGWTNWTFWQYSQSGSVAGVSGDVDQDWFNGSADDLASFVKSPAAYSGPNPVSSAPSQPAASSSAKTYTVQAGDTLSGIAARFGVSVESLAQANNIQNPNSIQVGQVLVIPS